MADKLEGRAKEILDGKDSAVLAIPRKDGTVQSVVVWADTDDDGNIRVNSDEGRAWPENLRRSGTATVTMFAEGSPWEWTSVTTRLVDDTHEGASEHIDQLAKKYLGVDEYPYHQPEEKRVKFTLRPERVTHTKAG